MTTTETASNSLPFINLYELHVFTNNWIERANELNVSIEPMLEGIRSSIANSHSLIDIHTGKVNEVVLVQQMRVRGMYCSQIIREITRQKILRLVDAALTMPALAKKYGQIVQCKNWALRQLPPEVFLRSPREMEAICRAIEEKVDEMRAKILR